MAITSLALSMALLAVTATPHGPGLGTEPFQEQRIRDADALYVCYFDQAGLQESTRAAMRAEVERIFGEIGVRVHGIPGAELAETDLPAGATPLRVLVMDRSPMAWDLKPNALGVMIGEQVPPTAVYAFAPTIRTAAGGSWVTPRTPAPWCGQASKSTMTRRAPSWKPGRASSSQTTRSAPTGSHRRMPRARAVRGSGDVVVAV